ncbi:Transposase [Piscirickettsia salmonis]|nr:Transposase [Piscirickettsia salmonis]QGP57999.1 Transposase [Piscirickettsia salmonis]QGP65704.1 Transposase [Piscirickettsia salmonis]
MSRHKCTKEIYKAFFQASSVRYSGLALSEVSPEPFSHDSVSRWLQSQQYRPRDIWHIVKDLINTEEPCLLVVDDTVLDKHRSKQIDLVHHQYSGNAHDVIAGIGLVNLVWYGLERQHSIPIDYRVYDKDTDGKTKNDHFREMLKLGKNRGMTPSAVVFDAWYSSLNNLKAARDLHWNWVAGLKKNRKVNRNETLEMLDFPDEGLKLHLRGYGWITVFRFVAKNGRTDYIGTNIEEPSRDQVEVIVKARWSIEVYHRELKQTCGIERCQARTGRAQRNHISLSIAAWVDKYKRKLNEKISLYSARSTVSDIILGG